MLFRAKFVGDAPCISVYDPAALEVRTNHSTAEYVVPFSVLLKQMLRNILVIEFPVDPN